MPSREGLRHFLSSSVRKLGKPVHLALVFVTPEALAQAPSLLTFLQQEAPEALVAGCCASLLPPGINPHSGKTGASQFQLLLLHLPGCTVRAAVCPPAEVEAPANWVQTNFPEGHIPRSVLLFANPFTLPHEGWMPAWRTVWPQAEWTGGMASPHGPGHAIPSLFCGKSIYSAGLLVLTLEGPVRVRSWLSTGYEACGDWHTVTAAEGNLLQGLDGQNPNTIYEKLIDGQPTEEGVLLAGFPPREAWPGQGGPEPGLLSRNLLPDDSFNGCLPVGAVLRLREPFRFCYFSERVARARLLADSAHLRAPAGERPFAALMTSCGTRSRKFFEQRDMDHHHLRTLLGDLPMAGYHSYGEVGPVKPGIAVLTGYSVGCGLFTWPEES